MEIVPALLETELEQFKDRLEGLVGFAGRIQVDFNDGSFEGNATLKPGDLHELVTNYTDRILFEAHLMVQRPREDKWISELVNLGFRKIIIQYEIEDNIREVLEEVRQAGVKVGLAIGPETGVAEIEPFGDLLDTVTIMTVEPGKQGQKFRPELLAKVTELRDGNFPGEIMY